MYENIFLVTTNGDKNGILVTKYYLLHDITIALSKMYEYMDREYKGHKQSINYLHFSRKIVACNDILSRSI